MNKTLVVNLMGGAGVGKTTLACKLFARLKEHGLNCELVTEYVKDMVYEGRTEVFKCQPYIFGKQLYKLSRINGKVDVIITDRPILLDIVYDDEQDENFRLYVLKKFNQFENLNIYLNRTVPFRSEGRLQKTVEEAIEYDKSVKYWLNELKIGHLECDVNDYTCDKLYDMVIGRLVANRVWGK